jgi:hypothetical protein
MHVGDDFQPHPSHEMGPWESSIVTIVATARFGSIRKCEHCGAEEAKTVCGHAAHDELAVECPGVIE